jgi:hypothetical protein
MAAVRGSLFGMKSSGAQIIFDATALMVGRASPRAVIGASRLGNDGSRGRSPHRQAERLRQFIFTIMILSAAASVGRAQPTGAGGADDFTSVEYFDAPHAQQIRSRLSGAQALPQAGGLLVSSSKCSPKMASWNGS